MAFTDTPVVESLGLNIARISGVKLGNAAAGVIKGYGLGGEVSLPEGHPGITDKTIVIVNETSAPAGGTPTVRKTKSGTPTDTLTLTNNDTNETGELDIIIMEPHSLIS